MERHTSSILVTVLMTSSAIAQTTYTNFIGTNEGKTIVVPANEIVNITLDENSRCTFNINLIDNTKKQITIGNRGLSKFITISPEQLLAELYSYQYYGLPYNDNGINSASPYTGKFDALTDLYQIHWAGQSTVINYYNGNLDATKTPLMSYTKDLVWESVNKGLELIKNLESLDSAMYPARDSIIAETKCIIAQHYFDLFMHFGGLPIHSDFNPSNNYHMGDMMGQTTGIKFIVPDSDMPWIHNRCSVEETVEYMVNLLDEAIPNLRWDGDKRIWTLNTERFRINGGGGLSIESRRWTQAGAMALKAKILLFAASPFFNSDTPYYGAISEPQKPLVWYGNYDASRWQKALEACQDFFEAFETNGYYSLVQAKSKNSAAYRQAYRDGYWNIDSKEALMTSRISVYYGTQHCYNWQNWNTWWNINRLNHSPSEEYAEMFPWSDGTPFRWEEDSIAGKVDGVTGKLFFEYKAIRGAKKTASRDPRMYENLICSCQQQLNRNGAVTGDIYELWTGGRHAGCSVADLDGNIVEKPVSFCPTGYAAMKYVMSPSEAWRTHHHWVMLSLDEMYLMYAEALAQTGHLTDAIQYIDIVRARVGMKSLATCYKSTYGIDLTTNKDLLVEEILRERACELGMTNNRFFDMVRYKRTDWMTRQLHGLVTIRMIKNSNGQWVERNIPWFGDDKNSGILQEPSVFKFYRFPLQTFPRVLWGKDKDSDEVRKWLLSPLPQEEIDKGLGLIQNPGW